ncbi:GldG family protein [bacterium]|nr:GldG family protein [bacterium]
MTKEIKKGKLQFGSTATKIVLIFIIIIAINVIAAGLYFRWDVTEENLYSLSEGTTEIVNGIQSPITIKYYHTKNLEGLPMTYKNYGKKINELLIEFKNLNPEMITYETYDPKPDSDEEEWAKKYGLSGIDLGTGERAFMGIVVIQEDNEISLPFMDPRREQFLEYDITQLLMQASQDKNKVVGIMSSLPVMGSMPNRFQQMQGQRPQPRWAFMEELQKTFKIKELKMDVLDIDDEVDILMVIHPKNLHEATQYAIDQFVMRGGELVILVDPNARVDEQAAMAAQMGSMASASSDLSKLFKHWGVQYESNKILGDKDHATRVNAGGATGVIAYSLWHSLNTQSFNQDLVATKELETMLLVEPGAFTLGKDSPLKLNSLLVSSQNSGFIDSYMTRFGNPVNINKGVKGDGTQYSLAGILTGELTSAFSKRPDPPQPKEGEQNQEEESAAATPKPYASKSQGSAKILLIADVDFISDTFSVDKFSLLGQTMIQPKNDNLNFMVNMVEFLGGAEAMMKIRSRGRFTRPFTRFEELQKNAQSQYQEAEERLSANLKDVQDKLSQLNIEKGTNKVVLTKEQIDKIEQFREEEAKTKTDLRKIRKLLRQDIESEKTNLTLMNLLLVPILMTIIGLALYYRRMKKRS